MIEVAFEEKILKGTKTSSFHDVRAAAFYDGDDEMKSIYA